MLSKTNSWKLQDAKAHFSELVRRARGGEPQHVTLHGREAVVVVDPSRFDVMPKATSPTMTGLDFIEASKKYRGAADGIDFDARVPMKLRDKRKEIFDGLFEDEEKA
jgi:prevent-host-death family protein